MAAAADPRLIIPLDLPTAAEARAMTEALGDAVSFYKVGLELFATDGMALGIKAGRDYIEFRSKGRIQVRLFFNTMGGSLQVTEQIEDLRLDGHVERADRLVADHEPRFTDQRACDGHADGVEAGLGHQADGQPAVT